MGYEVGIYLHQTRTFHHTFWTLKAFPGNEKFSSQAQPPSAGPISPLVKSLNLRSIDSVSTAAAAFGHSRLVG
jgi:hypothetical protein